MGWRKDMEFFVDFQIFLCFFSFYKVKNGFMKMVLLDSSTDELLASVS